MREPVRKILIIEPSVIIAEGIRHVIDNFSGFDVCGMLQYVSEEPEKQLGEYDADIVIVDMEAFDRSGRSAGRDTIKKHSGCACGSAAFICHGCRYCGRL